MLVLRLCRLVILQLMEGLIDPLFDLINFQFILNSESILLLILSDDLFGLFAKSGLIQIQQQSQLQGEIQQISLGVLLINNSLLNKNQVVFII